MQNKIVVKLKNPLIDLKKAEKCVSKNVQRPAITGCCFDFKNNRLQYTNLHMLVYFDLEIIEQEGTMTNKIVKPTDVSFLLNMKLPKEVKDFDTEYHFTDKEMSVVKNGVVYWKAGYISGDYPDFNSIIDAFNRAQLVNVGRYGPDMLKLVIDLAPKCIDFDIEMKKYQTTLTFDGGKALVMAKFIK